MKLPSHIVLLFVLLFLWKLPIQGQIDSPQQLIISPEQVASSFGYTGKLKAQDFASLGLTKPEVIQELNFTADDSTFLQTNVTVMTAGTLLTPQVRAAFEKAASSSSPPPNFKAVMLPDGTTAYLLSMGGPGGDGQEARMTSKDGRFDLAISITAVAGATYEQTASNRDYYEKMLGVKADPLAALAAALPKIYSTVSSNYSRIAAQKASSASGSSPALVNPQTQTTNSSLSPSTVATSVPSVPMQSASPSSAEPSTTFWTCAIIILIVGVIGVLWYRSRPK